MKKALSISFVYIGLVIGAGFASGREIFEYFCLPSQTDVSGIVLASTAFGLLAFITTTLAKKLEVCSFDGFIDKVTPKFSVFVKFFMTAFMFCGFFIMLSAAGTLFKNTFPLPFGVGVFMLAALCFAVFSFDLSGLVAVNTVLVPFMIVGMILLCIITTVCGIPVFSYSAVIKHNFLVAALCYASYNTITAGAVLVPVAKDAPAKSLVISSVVSSAVLGMLIFLVWLTLNTRFGIAEESQMPLLEFATLHGNICELLYALVLFMALCTTAIAHGFGIISKFQFRKKSDRVITAALLCLFAMPFAFFGFSDLIANVYSAFGFLGLGWTAAVIYSFFRLKE